MSDPKSLEVEVIDRGHWHRVIIRDGEQDVSHLGWAPMPVRVGMEGEVRMAGIGGVGTEPAYRRQGLARRVFAQSLEEMRAQGYATVGLFTGTDIVAHRLYRQFGFADVQVVTAAQKLLDPAAFIHRRLARLLSREDLPAAVRTWRCRLRVEVEGHRPLHLKISGGQVELLSRAPAKTDLTVALTGSTLLHLMADQMTVGYAETAHLVRWQGDASHWRLLVAVLCAAHEVVKEEG